ISCALILIMASKPSSSALVIRLKSSNRIFLNYPTMNSDFTIELNTNKIDHEQDWTVTLADTGALTMTGARVARAAGGSSFTGYWFAKELASAGHEVIALFRRQPEEYSDDLRRK